MDGEGGFHSKMLPISTKSSSVEHPSTPDATVAPSPAGSESPQSAAEAEGHIMAVRKSKSACSASFNEDSFEDIPLKAGRGGLSSKLMQVLDKRRAQEAESKNKMEMEHANALQRRDKIHMEQLDLMEAAHNRTVQHLEGELERLRIQFSGAMAKWEEADQDIKELEQDLATEREHRLRAEKECEDLSAVLEDNLA